MGAPFLAKQPRWAASIPSARPLRTGQPASARPRPSSSAMARPCHGPRRNACPPPRLPRGHGCAGAAIAPLRRRALKGVRADHPSKEANQDHPAKAHKQARQASEQPRARTCNAQRRANSAPAKPAPGPSVRSATPRADQGRWLGRGKACADQPCGRCPSQGNRSRATTTPHQPQTSTCVLARQRWLRVRFRAIGAPADPSPPAAAPARA